MSFAWGYWLQMGFAMYALWMATTKPLEASVIWVAASLIIVMRAEGKRTREENRSG